MKIFKAILTKAVILSVIICMTSCSKDETGGVMDGRWKSGGGREFTIKNGKVKCINDETTGTIEISDLPDYEYVILLHKKQDGFTSTKKRYINHSEQDGYGLCIIDGGCFDFKKIND